MTLNRGQRETLLTSPTLPSRSSRMDFTFHPRKHSDFSRWNAGESTQDRPHDLSPLRWVMGTWTPDICSQRSSVRTVSRHKEGAGSCGDLRGPRGQGKKTPERRNRRGLKTQVAGATRPCHLEDALQPVPVPVLGHQDRGSQSPQGGGLAGST